MVYGSCRECKHFDKCYLIATSTDRYPSTIPDFFNAIRRRDLCVNNDKVDWEQKSYVQ